jgi:hypothetical protein
MILINMIQNPKKTSFRNWTISGRLPSAKIAEFHCFFQFEKLLHEPLPASLPEDVFFWQLFLSLEIASFQTTGASALFPDNCSSNHPMKTDTI